jgi:MerR family transcriptional regulator, thiopeptide resistance regulator
MNSRGGTTRRSNASTTAATRCTATWWRCIWTDKRFTRYYDDVEPGLAQFLHDIVVESLNN